LYARRYRPDAGIGHMENSNENAEEFTNANLGEIELGSSGVMRISESNPK